MESCLEHVQSRLHRVISEGDVLADRVLGCAHEIDREQLNELIFHVLDEIQARAAVGLHQIDSEMVVRLLDAVVEHANEHVSVVCKVDHELLVVLHQLEGLEVAHMRVKEEQIALGR